RHAVCALEFILCLAGKDLERLFRRRGRKSKRHARSHSRLWHFLYRLRTDRRTGYPSVRGIGLLAQAEATGPSRGLGSPHSKREATLGRRSDVLNHKWIRDLLSRKDHWRAAPK